MTDFAYIITREKLAINKNENKFQRFIIIWKILLRSKQFAQIKIRKVKMDRQHEKNFYNFMKIIYKK